MNFKLQKALNTKSCRQQCKISKSGNCQIGNAGSQKNITNISVNRGYLSLPTCFSANFTFPSPWPSLLN